MKINFIHWGIPPQILVIYTTMSPIWFIVDPKVAPEMLFVRPTVLVTVKIQRHKIRNNYEMKLWINRTLPWGK